MDSYFGGDDNGVSVGCGKDLDILLVLVMWKEIVIKYFIC